MRDWEQGNSSSIFWIGILVFTALHFALTPVSIHLGDPAADPAAKPKEIYVELQGPVNPNDERPVVATTRAKETESAKDLTARFLGEERNRVMEETRARMRGAFKEGGGGRPETEEGMGEGLPPGPGLSDLLPFSTNPYDIPNAKDGMHTLLNTDPVIYASFMNRVTDEIYDPWNRFAREALTDPYVRKNAQANLYITKIRVLINREGDVASIQTLQSSGLDALDEAPKKAFWASAPFQNPPEKMFEADGFLRLTYEFHFELHSSSFNLLPLRL